MSAVRERRRGRMLTTAREVPPAIQWHEGMLLAPQHFQQLALRQESLLHYHAAALSPYHWGVRHLELDSVKLVDGVVSIVELEAVLPDGLVVARIAGDEPLSINLSDRADEIRNRPVMVHLAVAARGRGLALKERYGFDDGGPIADEITGDGELSVPVLRPKLHLIAGDDPPPKYISFPLVEITYSNETFTPTKFQPPWLRVARGSAIHDMCISVATRLREKAAFLADQVRAPSTSARVQQILDTKALVHYLVGELPPFEAVLRSGVAHPFALYLALCSVIGHVAGLGRSLVPPVLEPYDHNDLHATFAQAYAAITKALDEGIHEAYTSYPFLFDGVDFRLLFDPDWMQRALILGVRVGSGVSDADAGAWMASAVIGSRSKIANLRDRRVMGVRRKRIDADTDLVPSRGVTLYAISPEPEFVNAGEELVILNPDGSRRPEEIVLYVRNRV